MMTMNKVKLLIILLTVSGLIFLCLTCQAMLCFSYNITIIIWQPKIFPNISDIKINISKLKVTQFYISNL